jgi:transcriptional regulator with XRE-family HTH domain
VPTQASSIAALDAFVRARCGDGLGASGRFAHVVGIHANLLCAWRTGRARPTLALLLRVCQALGVSPATFLLSDTSSLPAASPAPLRVCRRQPHQPPAACDAAQLRQEVATLLAGAPSPPPSLAATARRLGCSSALLARVCPDACRVIVARYQAFRTQQRAERVRHLGADIREVMTQFDVAGIYPSARRVRARLQHRVHPRNSDFTRIRHQVLQDLGWNLGGTRISHG